MAIEFGPKDIYRTYGVPSLDLTFADKKSLVDRISGNNLITFTRSTTGTYVGSDGLIKTASVNEARFDHNPLTRESLGLLVEEARTNLVLRSEQFDNAFWSLENATVTTNTDIAPDGTLTADKLVPTVGTTTHGVAVVVDISASSAISIYVKYAGRQFVQLHLGQIQQTQAWANFDILNGTAGTIGGSTISSTITNAGNGWYRCSFVRTGSGSVALGLYIVSSASAAFATASTGDGTSGIFLWGAQLEAGAFPTSYIPTTASTVTRAADVASITGTNFSSWYNNDAGTTFFDARIKTPASFFSHGFLSQENTGHYRCGIYSDNWFAWTTNVGGIGDVGGGGAVINGRNKGVFAYDKNVPILTNSFNGNAVGSLAGRTPVSPTSVPLVYGPGSVRVSRLTYYPTRLPDTTLQALTKL